MYFRNSGHGKFNDFSLSYKKQEHEMQNRFYLNEVKGMKNRRKIKKQKHETFIPVYLEKNYDFSKDVMDKVSKVCSHNCSRGRRYELLKEIQPELEREKVPETIIENMENGNFKYNDFGKANVPAAIISLFGALAMVGAVASTVVGNYEAEGVKKIPVCSGKYKQGAPAIHEDKIAWIGGVLQIYVKEAGSDGIFGTEDDREIIISSNDSGALSVGAIDRPDIYKNTIVWSKSRRLNYNVSEISLSMMQAGPDGEFETNDDIETEFGMNGREPSIYGNNIVWTEEESEWGKGDKIYVKNIIKGNQIFIGEGSQPRIYKDKIVYSDKYGDIFMRDAGPDGEFGTFDDREIAICKGWSPLSHPDIGEKGIVWLDGRNHDKSPFYADIYMLKPGSDGKYGTDDDEEIPICTNGKVEQYPKIKIYENRIIWEDHRNEEDGSSERNSNIYMLDAGPDKEFGTDDDKEVKVYSGDSLNLDPDIYENKVVWSEDTKVK